MGRYKDFMMESADRPRREDSLLKRLLNVVGEDCADIVSETSDSDDEEEEFWHYSPGLHWDDFSELHAADDIEEYQEPAKEPPEEPATEEATEEPAADQEDSRTQARCSALEKLLQQYKSSECVNEALLKFTDRGLHEEAKVLLKYGADPNYIGYAGTSLLMRLVEQRESLDVLELLLEKGADPNLVKYLESELCEFFQEFLRNSEAEPEHIDYGVKAVRLLLRHGFRIHCCGDFNPGESLLEMSLEDFDRLFPLAQLLLEQLTPCGPEDHCYPRFETLHYRLTEILRDSSEAAVRPLVDKANALLDLLIEWPEMKRFTLSPLQDGHQGAEWAVDTVPASLQALSLAFVRRALLPRPLEAKIGVLPIPKLIQDLLKPVKLG